MEFLEKILQAFKAYGAATPLAKAIIHAAAFFTAALAWLILPDVLAAFGVTVASWKNGTFFLFSGIFFGTGLGMLLASILQNNRRQPQEEKRESPNQEGKKNSN